ncbi:MAG: gluconeogenesis factor YvcK family protein [Patescibacteria group bacterium]
MKHIVCIGGGTGMPRVLEALKSHDVHLSAIVTMADDGGSSGILRDEYGGLPPGDVRRVLVALSHSDQSLKDIFLYRFTEGSLSGHSVGNIILKALELRDGSFEQAIEQAKKILHVRGDVIPVTLDFVRLCAEFSDGTKANGERHVSSPENINKAVERIWLEPAANASTHAMNAIAGADIIVIGPGGFFYSIIPNFLVAGISDAVRNSSAKKIYIENLKSQIPDFDYIAEIKKYVTIDVVLPSSVQADATTLANGILTL